MRRARLLREPPRRVAARRTGAACAAALLLLPGCSGRPADGAGSGGAAGPARTGGVLAQPAAEPVPGAGHAPGSVLEPVEARGHLLRSRVTRVAGHLSDVRRDRVARRARAVVEGYLAGAFADEGDPFRKFTGKLRRAAASDGDLLTGTGDVEVVSARAWFSVAAPAGRPVGLTARLDVRLADGGRTGSLTGRLLLTRLTTRSGSAWRVFGYDLARSTDAGTDDDGTDDAGADAGADAGSDAGRQR